MALFLINDKKVYHLLKIMPILFTFFTQLPLPMDQKTELKRSHPNLLKSLSLIILLKFKIKNLWKHFYPEC